MRTIFFIILLGCGVELMKAPVMAQTPLGIRQTAIVGDLSLKTDSGKCLTIRYFSLKKISSIAPSLTKLAELQLLDKGLLVNKRQGWFVIQDSRLLSPDEMEQKLKDVKAHIADAYIVEC